MHKPSETESKYEVPTYYTARAEALKGSSDQAPYKLGFRPPSNPGAASGIALVVDG